MGNRPLDLQVCSIVPQSATLIIIIIIIDAGKDAFGGG
jgi:hypothetical protein